MKSQPSACAETAAAVTVGKAATCTNAHRLATWLAADWSNKSQALDNPQFWSHIHVCFRPLSWEFLDGCYSFYSESAYDYALGRPYKSAVYRIVEEGSGALELECYKLKDASEFWLGAHEPEILEDLRASDLELMTEHCNTIYQFNEANARYNGNCRPGNKCIIRRAGRGPPTYVDSTLELQQHRYSAWDLGRDPETHERVWGTAAGPFEFIREKDLAHLVPAPRAGGVARRA